MSNRRVVITGIGVISSAGLNPDDWWENITDGKSFVKRIDMFDGYDIKPKPLAAIIENFDPEKYIADYDKYRPYLDRGMTFAMAAAEYAFNTSGLHQVLDEQLRERFGIYVGTTTGGICSAFDVGVKCANGFEQTNDKIIYSFPPASWPALLASRFEAEGILRVAGTSCYAGSEILGLCYRDIKDGKTNVAIVGGLDAPIVLTNYLSFLNIGAMSSDPGEADKVCRPFSKDRTGMVFGEGAAFFVVEELEEALKRKAHIYAEISGYAATSDGESMVKPSTEGNRWADAITSVLKESAISADDIDYVSCHGTGTLYNDKAEVRAIKLALGKNTNAKIGSIKSMIGHSFGGACALEIAQIIKTFETDILPPTINYSEKDEECDMDVVPNNKIENYRCNYILKTATGFGGSNLALVFKRWDE